MKNPTNLKAVLTAEQLNALNFRPIERIYPWKRPCPQKILVVTDGYPGSFLNASFSKSYFGLSTFINTMLDQSDYYVRFNLTLAHRQTDDFKPAPGDPNYARFAPNFENFRFTTTANDVKTNVAFNLDHYDQVWLFGTRSGNPTTDPAHALTDNELILLTNWMEAGGGLFATGDHAEIGSSLCGRVPRASKMRLWEDNSVDAHGSLISPPSNTGPNRHDTLLKGYNAVYTFDDESDDIPMRISPKFYYSWSWHPFYKSKHPHPILCGKNGVIDILPDHPHEGHVIDEDDVNLSGTLINGAPEFRMYSGTPLKPEVIARAHVQNDHTASDFKGLVNPKSFGAIGAYDGYLTDVGRVVVDSTWHHWFDVNLTGRDIGRLDSTPYSALNPKTEGFLASASGIAALARIQNYYVNIGLWLAPKSDRQCMLNGLFWHYVMEFVVIERFKVKTPILEFGVMAKDALGRRASQCQLREWIIDIVPIEIKKILLDFEDFEPHKRIILPNFEIMELYVLGGVVRKLLDHAYELEKVDPIDTKTRDKLNKLVGEIFVVGAAEGLEEMLADFKVNANYMSSFDFKIDLKSIEKSIKQSGISTRRK